MFIPWLAEHLGEGVAFRVILDPQSLSHALLPVQHGECCFPPKLQLPQPYTESSEKGLKTNASSLWSFLLGSFVPCKSNECSEHLDPPSHHNFCSTLSQIGCFPRVLAGLPLPPQTPERSQCEGRKGTFCLTVPVSSAYGHLSLLLPQQCTLGRRKLIMVGRKQRSTRFCPNISFRGALPIT